MSKLQIAGRRPSRRDWLRIGLPLAALGAAPAGRKRAKTVIVVFTGGGMSQLDTFDPKPDAPAEIRGAFKSIPSAVPGVRVCEHLPELAARAGRFTLVRSVTHDDADHGSACYWALTGQRHPQKSSNPPPRPTDYPALGAVLHRVRPTDKFPHSAFHVNGPLLAPKEVSPGQSGGFLGRGLDPIELGRGGLPALARPADVSAERAADRRRLAAVLDKSGATMSDVHPELVRKAYDLIDAPGVRRAFDLSQETQPTRDRYGRYRAGQACLLARRLAEAGVPWITVFFNHSVRGQDDHPDDPDEYGWDTHNDVFAAMREHLLPRFDRSVSALLDDLAQRGLSDDVLVCCLGEFGRAPLVAKEKTFAGESPGRKHWPGCYTTLMSGGGVARGGVFGKSDARGAYPAANPVNPSDVAATLFAGLGIPADAHYPDAAGRPHRAIPGEPIAGVFG